MKKTIFSIFGNGIAFALIFTLLSFISGSEDHLHDIINGLIAGAAYGCWDPLIQKWRERKS